jgi:hypothetical protein
MREGVADEIGDTQHGWLMCLQERVLVLPLTETGSVPIGRKNQLKTCQLACTPFSLFFEE